MQFTTKSHFIITDIADKATSTTSFNCHSCKNKPCKHYTVPSSWNQ